MHHREEDDEADLTRSPLPPAADISAEGVCSAVFVGERREMHQDQEPLAASRPTGCHDRMIGWATVGRADLPWPNLRLSHAPKADRNKLRNHCMALHQF